jgi:hypothetical protein
MDQNIFILLDLNIFIDHNMLMDQNILKIDLSLIELGSFITSTKRIGPHNIDIIEFSLSIYN